MHTITTTQLRTKSKYLVKALGEGRTIDLIHRSRIVGEIRPKEEFKTFNAKRFQKIVEKLNLPVLSDEEIEKRYRSAMKEKHGESISGRK